MKNNFSTILTSQINHANSEADKSNAIILQLKEENNNLIKENLMLKSNELSKYFKSTYLHAK